MKLKKTKLSAIMMSALMAVSTMSPLVYAEDDAAIIEDVVVEGTDLVVEEEVVAPVAEVTPVAEQAADPIGSPVTGAYELVPGSVKFMYPTDKSYNVEYQVKWVEGEEEKYAVKNVAATEFSKTNADCVKDGLLVLKVEILKQEFQSDEFIWQKALGHDDKEIKRQTLEVPTHKNDGLAHVWYKCNRCGREIDKDETLPAQEHIWSDKYTYTKLDNVVLDKDGVPQLDDWTKDGSYWKHIACTKCADVWKELKKDEDGNPVYEVREEILAKTGVWGDITKQDGLAVDLVNNEDYDHVLQPTTVFPLENDKIELSNCTKDGWYIVTYYQNDGKKLSEEKIVVKAHHMLTPAIVEFRSEDDRDQCVVDYAADGKSYTITNKSCYLPITYDEVIHCTAAGCPNKDCNAKYYAVDKEENPAIKHNPKLSVVSVKEAVAAPKGEHIIDKVAKDAITNELAQKKHVRFDDGKTVTMIDGATYEQLQELKEVKNNPYVVVKNDTSKCLENGTAEVEYRCMVCYPHIGTVVKTEKVDVTKKGHIVLAPTRENYKAPTCTDAGVYDAVTYCERCKEVIREKRNIKIPRITHTNEKVDSVDPKSGIGIDDVKDVRSAKNIVIDLSDKYAVVVAPNDEAYKVGKELKNTNYIGYGAPYKTLGVSFAPKSVCDTCGKHTVALQADGSTDVRPVTIVVTDLKKETSSGKAGSITVKVTYQNKTAHTETFTFQYFSSLAAYQGRVVESPLNGLHLEKDGKWQYYVDGEFQKDFYGIVKYDGEEFFVSAGVKDTANGLNLFNGKWYFLADGRIVRGYNSLALYDGEWFYLINGELNKSVSGIVRYDGGEFLFAEGRLVREHNGLWQDPVDGTWYYLARGEVQKQYSGVVQYDGGFFVVKNGILDEKYNGTIDYDGAKFNVVNGRVWEKVA